MKWSAYDNKNLIVPDHEDYEFQGKKYKKAILNDYTNSKLTAIDKYWPPNSEIVTSVIRTSEDSLRIIRQYLHSKNLARVHPEAMTCEISELNESNYFVWQKGWSNLLNIGIIVNPPLPAICLMDYFRDGLDERGQPIKINKKGQVIGQSPHIPDPKNPMKGAADLSGLDSLTIVKRLAEDKMIRGFLVERANNCIHLDL